MQHGIIYREQGRYAGWPANYGIWSWGNEIVVGFVVGYHKTQVNMHHRDRNQPFTTMQARSLDGGISWDVQPMPIVSPGNRALSADEHVVPDLRLSTALKLDSVNKPQPCPGGVDFAHPDFALLCARTGLGAGTVSWFYISTNRCHSWEGPFCLPMFNQAGVEARTDVHISDGYTCTLFLSASRPSGEEGAGVFCVRSTDGGKSFQFHSWVTRVDEGYVIMPSSLQLANGRWLTTVRCKRPDRDGLSRFWIDLYVSDDDAQSWRFLAQPVPDTGSGGNPPALMQLQDGRTCLTYGYRNSPFGIRSRISEDGGQTWSPVRILRDDGGSGDLGYPRTVQRPDGKIVTVYYFNDEPEGAGYIASTIWNS